MPNRRGLTLLEDLPEEIIDKILIRLPSKDVGRCRVVSTLWRSTTSTSEFMLQHHRRQPSLPIIDGGRRPAGLVVFGDTGAGASNQQPWPFFPSIEHRNENRLHGACDDFLIISWRSHFYIYNPVIRNHALLPQPQLGQAFYNTIIGFYRYHPTGEYRVLYVSQSRHLSKSSLYVLTVGSDKPRHITVTMPAVSSVSSPSVEHKLLQKLCYSPSAVHHRGSLHWCPCGANGITGGGGDIIVFDTVAESFRWMHSPTKTKPCHTWKVFSMKGVLAFWHSSTPSFTAMDVWVMQDYEAEIWTFKYQIDVSTVEASRQLYLTSFKKNKKPQLNSAVQCFEDVTAQ